MFIGEHKDALGVEPVCRVLTASGWQIAPGTYYAAVKRPASARAVRDARILAEIRQMRTEYEEVYGARKTWLDLNRRGIPVARCTVERVMRRAGLRGARRGRRIRTTVPGKGPGHERAPDLLKRDFTAPAPNRRWVADFTHVAALSGTVYVAFVVDIFSRMITGWAAARHKRAKLVLDALDMALWHRSRAGHRPGAGLVHHSDAGSQGEFNRSSQHLQVEVGEWDGHRDGRLLGRGGRRCVRRGGLRWPGGNTGSGSGWRSPGECRVRTLALRLVCPR